MKKNRIVLTVTNDIHTDNRVNRTCMLLIEEGFEVTVIGRNWPDHSALIRPYHTHRFSCVFNKGALFYVEFQIRLLIHLLLNKFDYYLANDIDTAYPVYLVSKWRRKPFILDSHEYFTASPELEGRPLVKGVWKWIERRVIPHLKKGRAVTVSQGIADTFLEEYGVKFEVVRNIPERSHLMNDDQSLLRKALNLPEEKKILILQGSGINKDRGAEEMLEAMSYLPNYLLLIVGKGDVVPVLKQRVEEKNWEDRVKFVDRQPVEILRKYTRASDIGLSLDKDTNLNYHFSLPNKVFDYMHAGIPVFASNLPEVRNVVDGHCFGVIFYNHHPEEMARIIEETLENEDLMREMKQRAIEASKTLNWETEKEKWSALLRQIKVD